MTNRALKGSLCRSCARFHPTRGRGRTTCFGTTTIPSCRCVFPSLTREREVRGGAIPCIMLILLLGNANRFVSVKNCYEICHPSDPQVKKPRVVSGIKAYLAPSMKQTCDKKKPPKKGGHEEQNEVVIRQVPHPLDPRKTLTIIQNARYINRPSQFAYGETFKSVPLNNTCLFSPIE